jgi:hypothetical protein
MARLTARLIAAAVLLCGVLALGVAGTAARGGALPLVRSQRIAVEAGTMYDSYVCEKRPVMVPLTLPRMLHTFVSFPGDTRYGKYVVLLFFWFAFFFVLFFVFLFIQGRYRRKKEKKRKKKKKKKEADFWLWVCFSFPFFLFFDLFLFSFLFFFFLRKGEARHPGRGRITLLFL